MPSGLQKGPSQAGTRSPVSIPAWRVRIVVPCYNRAEDAALLLHDLAQVVVGSPPRAALSVVLVDNGSTEPLDRIAVPEGLDLTHVRLESNTGGSGGFNAGLSLVLGGGRAGDRSELIWLLDSDVRVEPGALLPLLDALAADPDLVAAGSALVDPATGKVFEIGGRIDRRTGEYRQPLPRGWEKEARIEAEYLAACSLMVRRTAIEHAGLMADLFVNGDDVEWSLRMAQRTGGLLAAIPASRAIHPHPDKMRTWARYYAARNAFYALDAAGCRGRTRFIRGLREVGRAVGQVMVGRDDLADLHLQGLADAFKGQRGAAPEGTIKFEPWQRTDDLGPALRKALATNPPRGRVMIRAGVIQHPAPVQRALNAACVQPVITGEQRTGVFSKLVGIIQRIVLGPRWGFAIVSARARAEDWLAGRVIVTVAPEGFVIRKMRRLRQTVRSIGVGLRGARLSLSLAMAGPRERTAPVPTSAHPLARATVSVVILSYNRREALQATLSHLAADESLRAAQIVVSDNGSSDGSATMIRTHFPRTDIAESATNRGVAGFNSGVARATGDLLLILDDDAWPDAGAIQKAADVLGANPDLGAVALHPRHPGTKASEWPFAEGLNGPRNDWPLMGCGNLVRREVWERLGGYEESFFLYRNDTDLAMKILGAGYGVHFDPALVVWHDSPAAARKSPRWFHLATRNWVWLCRRHGRGMTGLLTALLGVAWAHRLAGLSPGRHWAALRGWLAGWVSKPPPLPRGLRRDGQPIASLLRLRLGR